MDGIEIILDDGSNRVARRKNVFVQFRRGKLTIAALDGMLESYRLIARTTTGPIFALFVIAADADVPNANVRVRQKEVLAEIARDGRMRAAVVVEGEGIFAHLGRTIVSGMSPGIAALRDVETAARELARMEGAPAESEILSVAAAARTG
jgi:hypothetical protein